MKPLVPIVFLASLCVWESVRFTFVAKVAEMKFYGSVSFSVSEASPQTF